MKAPHQTDTVYENTYPATAITQNRMHLGVRRGGANRFLCDVLVGGCDVGCGICVCISMVRFSVYLGYVSLYISGMCVSIHVAEAVSGTAMLINAVK